MPKKDALWQGHASFAWPNFCSFKRTKKVVKRKIKCRFAYAVENCSKFMRQNNKTVKANTKKSTTPIGLYEGPVCRQSSRSTSCRDTMAKAMREKRLILEMGNFEVQSKDAVKAAAVLSSRPSDSFTFDHRRTIT
ncbi:hypothetical protein M514_01938, partial [Trichuris suis]